MKALQNMAVPGKPAKGRGRRSPRGLAAAMLAAGLALGGSALTAQAQSQSMEDRLRSQLRSTTQQLQSVQSQQAQLAAAKTAAETQLAAAQKELEQLRGQLGKAQSHAVKLEESQDAVREAARSQVQASHAQVGKFKTAYDELLGLARTKEAERAQLQKLLAERSEELKVCQAKNHEMYAAGKDILNAYESFSNGGVFKLRQPFAAGSRVTFEEQAQAYGDKLYGAQVEARAVSSAPADDASSATQSAAPVQP